MMCGKLKQPSGTSSFTCFCYNNAPAFAYVSTPGQFSEIYESHCEAVHNDTYLKLENIRAKKNS